jgi:hypothetical protein
MILIVGGHPDYQDKVPDHDQRWVMAKSHDRDATMAFEMHKRDNWLPRVDHINDFDCPVVMQEQYPEVPRSISYPLTEVTATFGCSMTCTITYMVALALMHDHEVALWGVGGDTELYGFQTPQIAFLAGFARGQGLSVTAHPDSKLHRILNPCARYGYDGCGELFR